MISKMLLPVDGSSFSERAGEHGIYLAKKLEAELIAVHVIKVGTTKKLESENIEKVKLKQANICFSSLKDKAAQASVEIETKIIVSRNIANAVLEEAKDGDYDLIVMGSHGLSGLKKLVLGSITEEILKKSTMPVLIVR